ncbi:MAG: DNA-3-methyladenine glycosylase [Acidobacteria bacterium RBG_16_68_9]|nr:MAG: DNA-3-methyladenine glycosylase [Acidobacteria bacterium RBG_16_68_9]
MTADQQRCAWAGDDPLYVRYHDEEWGVPLHDDRRLFEHLVLDGAQAGLSWLTILKKRESYRRAFAQFDPRRVARFGPGEMNRLLADRGIVRNRLKLQAAIDNAGAFLAVQREFGSFDRFIWSFTGGRTIQNRRRRLSEIPVRTRESEAMSRALRQRGFRFVGPVICYAFMQAAGMVNDHTVDCFRYAELARIRKYKPRSYHVLRR